VHYGRKKQENLKLSFVHGHHADWTLVIGEQLVCEREEGNPRDQYAVAV